MRLELLKEKPMRGCLFEHVGRIWIRRQRKNNYIFATRQFDSLEQILNRYNLKVTQGIETLIKVLSENFSKIDLIEFVLDESKAIRNIDIYDVKSKYYSVKRTYFEFCKSNYNFLLFLEEKYNIKPKIISIILLKNWNCDIKLFSFDKHRARVYKYHKKKKIS